ncbi:MAG: DNA-3-methyladenine glycosylase I [Actinomycetota bacterium]
MKVTVVCFGAMRAHLPPDAQGNRAVLEANEDARVIDIVRALQAPERLVYALLVNEERAELEDSLSDGDEITLMPPFTGGESLIRCPWAGGTLLEIDYHDTEWGVPLHDDRSLFEFLVLEGVQAGLSWSTVLARRDSYRAALDGFDAAKIARYDDDRVALLLTDRSLIRNRLKMRAAVTNARSFLEVTEAEGSFAGYLWRFVDGKPLINRWKAMSEIPSETEISKAMSKDLKRRGFSIVGPTICYALMQATGMVNDHLVSCFRYAELS